MAKSKKYLLLVINPGSTSTKLGIFENENCVSVNTLRHSPAELEKYDRIWDQYEFRKEEIIRFISTTSFNLSDFDAIVGRGGLLHPIESGTYEVDPVVINDLRLGVQGQHASNLGGVLAYGLAWDYNIPSFIVDPPAVDEFDEVSRISGMADVPRLSQFHALNIKATARKAARDLKSQLDKINLVVAHLGGGVTIAALRNGRAIDANNGISEGPFTPERSGAVPLVPLIDMCFSGKYTKKEIMRKIVGGGGLVSYLKTNVVTDIEKLIKEGDKKAKLILDAMAYQISTQIAAMTVALYGKVDGIILTGGMAHSKLLVSLIQERCGFLAKIYVYPGEDELEALALGGLRVVRGEEKAKKYTSRAPEH